MFCCILNLNNCLLIIFVAILSALVVSDQFRRFVFGKLLRAVGLAHYVQHGPTAGHQHGHGHGHGPQPDHFQEQRPVWLKGFTELKSQSPNQKLKILEVGVNNGRNFEFYPDNSRLTALEYNDKTKEEFLNNVKNYPKIEFDKYITGTVEDMNQLEDNSFDAVLMTHVFCQVGDVPKGLQEVKRVLKEGGKYFFMEHGAYNQATFNYWSLVQYAMNPIAKIVYGASLTKKNWIVIENTGFKSTTINHAYPEHLPGYVRAQIWGVAVK